MLDTVQRAVANEFLDKKLTVMLLQETKIQNQDQIEITATNGRKLIMYNSGHKNKSLKGVAVLALKETAITFKPVDERICIAEIRPNKISRKKFTVLSTYAPTEDDTLENPEKTDTYYNKLGSIIQTVCKRNSLLIGGDFNARTRLDCEKEKAEYADTVGKYARSKANTNSRKLLELLR